MGQLGIVHRDQHFREYEIEATDRTVRAVCLRFGRRDWRAVYDLEVNRPFRQQFADPERIGISAVHLFIPLQGAANTGTSVRGEPLGNYIIIRCADKHGAIFPHIKLTVFEPARIPGQEVTTDNYGEVVILNPTTPLANPWTVTSRDYVLMPVAGRFADYEPEDMFPIRDRRPFVSNIELPLVLNQVNEIAARRAFYIVCPLCGRTFRTVDKPEAGPSNPNPADSICPNDGYNLSTIETAIETDPGSFLDPRYNQDLYRNDVTCRGKGVDLNEPPYTFDAYWDESRFVHSDGGNYAFWGWRPDPAPLQGNELRVPIIGRATWGAGPPVRGAQRPYEFHSASQGASPPYRFFSIPSNEAVCLSSVFKWITVHHTNDPAQSSPQTVRDLQTKHQVQGIEGVPAADIGYHFVIDADGVIYEGRPLGVEGHHAARFNGGNIGIVLAGDFEPLLGPVGASDVPTAAATGALDNLVEVLSLRFGVRSVWTHMQRKRQAEAGETECPGQRLIPHVEALRRIYSGPPD